jgi:hypothetical protein
MRDSHVLSIGWCIFCAIGNNKKRTKIKKKEKNEKEIGKYEKKRQK